MALTWDAQRMSTGVAEIDAQHQELIRQLNRLFEHMHAGKGGETLNDLLDFCARYARTHFAHEEACMHQRRCPNAAANRDAHAEFNRVFGDFRQRLQAEGPTTSLTLQVQQQLSAWLRSHIVGIDRQCFR